MIPANEGGAEREEGRRRQLHEVQHEHALRDFVEVVVLMIVAVPKHPEHREAQQIAHKRGGMMSERVGEFPHGATLHQLGYFQFEHQDRHRDGKDAVDVSDESLMAFQT